ncbi:MAG: Panacea domain-containing protein [Micavibrio sp.]
MLLTPPLSPRLSAVAKRICELGNWNVSNLRLQKLTYICHMIYMGRHQRPLIGENFEAWMYGPVIPNLYRKMKIFGADPVCDRFYNAEPLPADMEEVINEVCTKLKESPDSQLVSITHRAGGGWSQSYRPEYKNAIIKQEDILNEYRTRSAR